MWQPWKKKPDYKIPLKPRIPNKQLSMIWEQCFNHLPGQLEKIDWRLHFQDIKINFILVLMALILAFLVRLT